MEIEKETEQCLCNYCLCVPVAPVYWCYVLVHLNVLPTFCDTNYSSELICFEQTRLHSAVRACYPKIYSRSKHLLAQKENFYLCKRTVFIPTNFCINCEAELYFQLKTLEKQYGKSIATSLATHADTLRSWRVSCNRASGKWCGWSPLPPTSRDVCGAKLHSEIFWPGRTPPPPPPPEIKIGLWSKSWARNVFVAWFDRPINETWTL